MPKRKARQAAFVYPPDDTPPQNKLAYNTVDTINVSWTSRHDRAYLRLLCSAPNDPDEEQAWTKDVPATGSHKVLLIIESPGECHFWLGDYAHPQRAHNSSFFAVNSNPDAKPHTYGADTSDIASNTSADTGTLHVLTHSAAPTEATGSTSSPGVAFTAAPASESLNTTSAPASSTITTGEGVGIGIGVAAGCVLLLTGMVLLYFRRRRQRKDRNNMLEKVEAQKQIRAGRLKISEPRDFRRIDGMDEAGSGERSPTRSGAQSRVETVTEPPSQELDSHTNSSSAVGTATGAFSRGVSDRSDSSGMTVGEAMHAQPVQPTSELNSMPGKDRRPF